MKMPKIINTHCPSCRRHTEHTVEKVKKGQPSPFTRIVRQKQRQQGIGNAGKFSKVPGGDKPTKRVYLRYRCKECGKAHQREGFRVKRFELV
ncbi:50S ribosomal protein L44e [Methermicoccus shengliensis]|uniref:Large ribosomal subunit protein eL42 n=1 Tax=Methermicoccus shengliensis TaxID=660064 RepID=A0A832RX76_9EURY|nr:50S ribosomal protein L44e [Methermicoccus shengliensis]KUK04402.1 MAG: 50S ribosomal protein L44e [Euryarchaeota archaeon 55_53]KUK30213.1 MAG: 50S ribosomal protein L44e [Methanosarcinales archeaon 56_1174]MDI3488571.1 large subunit ribosomal protein L44e [Methanosarcinales archaeon]MDN5295773.1 large subunit ribosomal protein L44e [Methanosarcinales archaeon]HIH69051.1 50S ribosomal protein L44e [Methermicoccus shengliensis]